MHNYTFRVIPNPTENKQDNMKPKTFCPPQKPMPSPQPPCPPIQAPQAPFYMVPPMCPQFPQAPPFPPCPPVTPISPTPGPCGMLAHAYVPWQCYNVVYSPCEALDKGTLFPELYMPQGVYGPCEGPEPCGGVFYGC